MPWRSWRERAGLTQQELADRVQMDRSVLSRVESGRRSVSVRQFARLADALGLTADERLHALTEAQAA